VVKDRSTLLDGREFINRGFRVFMPHIDRLNIGGAHVGVDVARNRSELFDTASGRTDSQQKNLQKEIVLEEIQNLLVLPVPGQTVAEKQRKVKLVKDHFNATWKESEEVLSLEQVRQGYDTVHQELEGAPSRYSVSAAKLDDEISDFKLVEQDRQSAEIQGIREEQRGFFGKSAPAKTGEVATSAAQ
jgi:hypothetical protein